jgi:predicted ATPase/DNA-binding XRE family transcriptional regulator
MQEDISFGVWLRKQRRTLDLSQQAFANQVGCAEVTLRRIEAGTLKPSKELVSILLEKLGIPETDWPHWISFARGVSGFPLSSSPSSNKPISNLPAPLTSFIGREKEKSDVIGLIIKHRLVTLTGSGGVGKTRLAIQIVAEVLDMFPDGIWFLDLAPLSDPELVPNTLANCLGLRESGDPKLSITDLLISYLRSRTILVIFDNCEHLIESCAQLANSLLTGCENLAILATSREVLRISGEIAYRVPSLELHKLEIEPPVDVLAKIESVRLFIERVATVSEGFTISSENAIVIAQICQRLDGIPLAIELAAARAHMLTVHQIAKRLDDRFNLLTIGLRTTLRRHQTLRAMIEWSYDLLSENECIIFRRLAVFVGGWTLESAEEVCSGNGIEANNILDLLSQLVNKSLLMVENTDGVPRYHRLETIHQFMREKLMESDEKDAFFQTHAEYFLKFAEAAEPHLIRAEQITWINGLEIEHDNMRAALQWFMKLKHGDSALRLASALGRFWHLRGLFGEGREHLEEALQIGIDSDKKLRAKALCWVGILAYTQGNYEVARKTLNRSFAISHKLEDIRGMADALYFIGVINRIQADYAKAQRSLEESLKLYDSLNDIHGVANTLINLGNISQSQGDDVRGLKLFEESLEIFQRLAYKRGIAYASLNLGNITRAQEDVQRSWEFYKESLLLSYELGDRWSVAYALSGLANVLCSEGQHMLSARVQAVVTYLLDELATEFEPFEQREYNKTTTALQAALGEEGYRQGLEVGKTLSLEKAIELAIQNH